MPNRTRIRISLSLIFMSMTAAVICVAQSARGTPAISLTDNDSGKTIAMKVGQSLAIRLPANPTTGYSWTLADKPELLPLRKSEYVAGAGKDGAMGAGGTQVFGFAAADSGTATIKLNYRRPWENDPPARSFTVTVNITPSPKCD
jgi:inhibitor of cysteine peptidase